MDIERAFWWSLTRIKVAGFKYKGAEASVTIAPELAAATEAVPLDANQARILMQSAESKATTAGFMITDSRREEARALHRAMGSDMRSLESLAAAAEKVPRLAIEQAWDLLKKHVSKTAELYGLRREEEDSSDLHQAVHYLNRNVFKSQSFLIGVYALAAALQKVDKNQNAVVSVDDARLFVENCMAIITDLSSKVDELISSEN